MPISTPLAETPYVLTARDGGIVTVTLNRGDQFNPLSEQMLEALQAEFDALAQDDSARVVVLAAAGRAFCAGHDLKQMIRGGDGDGDGPSAAYYNRLFSQCSKLMLSIQKLPQPVIARVQGLATAAGCQLVASCDLALAASDARFAVSGISVGLFCATPAVALSRNIGRKQAMEMLLTGDFIDAETARVHGLVNRVVTTDRLDAAIAELAASIVAKPAVAVTMGKQLFYRQLEMGVAAAYQLAGQTMSCNMMDESAQEGVQAFVDKRKPDWSK